MMWDLVQNQLDKQSMSVYRLSKLTGIPNPTIFSYKNNGVEPTFSNMVKIADALGVSLDEFRSDKGNGQCVVCGAVVCDCADCSSDDEVRWWLGIVTSSASDYFSVYCRTNAGRMVKNED